MTERESLRVKAQSRRNSVNEDLEEAKGKWTCGHCSHAFQSEKVFMKHVCKEQRRAEELKSLEGKKAYLFYSEWMKLKKRTTPPIETFGESMFFASFFRFAKHVVKVGIPNPIQFIRVMVEHGDIPPSLWCRDNVYSTYVTWYDVEFIPENQVLESLTAIELLMKDYNAGPENIFEEINHIRLRKLIKERKLSPWFLLASEKFRTFLAGLPIDHKSDIESALNIGAMIIQIRKSPEMFKMFNMVAKEKGL